MPPLVACADQVGTACAQAFGKPEPPPVAPADDPFPALIFALLDRQNAPAKSVCQRLRLAGLLEPAALATIHPNELASIVAETKAPRPPKWLPTLQRLATWVNEVGTDALANRDTESLRDELRAIRGIGPGLADALLLFGLGRPTLPVDRSAVRVFVRHGWLELTEPEDEARANLEQLAPGDPQSLARWSFWLDRIGQTYCKAKAPDCDPCPLRPFLPETGPLEPDG